MLYFQENKKQRIIKDIDITQAEEFYKVCQTKDLSFSGIFDNWRIYWA